MLFLFVIMAYCCIMALIVSEPSLLGQKAVTMLRWFFFLTAVILLTLGLALTGLILASPADVPKDDDDD